MDTLCLIVVFYGTFLSNIHTCICHTSSLQFANLWQTSKCDIINITMTCEDIPKTVPYNVRKVVVTFHRGSLNNAFLGNGWHNVECLEISGDARYIDNGDLRGLGNLREMSLSMIMMQHVASNVFSDTPSIEKLSLLKMNAFDFGTLLSAVTQAGVTENLTEENFDPYTDDQSPPRVIILNNVVNRLVERPLTTLKVSNSFILIEVMAIGKIVLKLDKLNVSGSQLVWTDGLLASHLNFNVNLPLFKTLDVSGLKTPYRMLQHVGQTVLPYIQTSLLHSEHVYMDNMWNKEKIVIFPNYTSNSYIFLKSFYCRRSSITEIRGKLLLNTKNAIKLIDFSGNKIGYIQPAFFATAGRLKSLFLSHNELSKMQMMPEFPELTAPLRQLTVLYLDANGISFIPWNMFTNNQRLEVLNIADNKLTTIAFNVCVLTSLKLLDMGRNNIHYMDGENLVKLVSFVKEREKNTSFDIRFQGNPLQCSCESLEFIKWLHTIGNSEKCKYESSNINVDESAVSKCEFLCRRKYIIAGTTTAAVVVTVLLVMSIYAILRVKQRSLAKDKVHNFMHAFNNNLLPYDHICFVAYAGKDEESVRKSLLTPLDAVLKEKLNTNKEVICTGYSFKPGYAIYDEAYRLIKNSRVFVAVVSDAFCESKYCRGEIREACTQQKSVIIILLGTVAEENMSPYLVEVFRRNARAKMFERDDGNFDLVPDVNIIAESVVTLAIEAKELDTGKE